MQKSGSVPLAAIIVIALVVRLVAIYESGPSVIRFGDAPDYLSAATSLCSAGSYPDRSSMPFFRAPGLPFFIVATTLCHPEKVWLIKISLAGLDVISVAIVFLLAEELFRNRWASMLSAGFAAIYPFFIAQVCEVQTEGLFMFLFLAAIWLRLRAVQTPGSHLTFLAGVCASAAALVRPVGLVLLPLLAATSLCFGIADRSQYGRRLWSFGIGAALCLGPWVIRNEIQFGELILVNDAGGYNFWRGTSAEMARIDRLTDRLAFAQASIEFETVTSPGIAHQIDLAATTPSSRSREWYRRGIRNFTEDTHAFVSRLARNAFAYWRPWLNPQAHSRAVVAATGLMVMSLYLFAFMGWNILRKRHRRLAIWCAVGAASFFILQIPFQAVSRFRIPVVDPFLLIFAAASLSTILNHNRPKDRIGCHGKREQMREVRRGYGDWLRDR